MRRRTWAGCAAVAVLAGGLGGGVFAVGARSSASDVAVTPTTPAVTRTTTTGTPSSSGASPAAAPFRVVGVAHASAGSTGLAVGAVTVSFSQPVGTDLTPSMTPHLAGAWTHPSATTAVFVPTQVPLPGAHVSVVVPAGTTDAAGGVLAATSSTTWVTRPADPSRLQQLLAESGYLPLMFTPTTAEPTTGDGMLATAYAPVGGTYAWRFAPPAQLKALYTGASSTLLTRGALLAFQSAHGLATDGAAGPAVWTALSADAAARSVSARPYTNVVVTKARPETLVLYRDGVPTLTTHVNTGVAGAATPDGSWAVYARFTSQTMSGTNPDGSHYSDPGVPWINYFYGGDAVHGFPRSSYGSPQSVGCVELPIATAKTVYGYMGYGNIVTVQG